MKEKNTEYIHSMITKNQKEILEDWAEKNERTISFAVRKAVTKFVEEILDEYRDPEEIDQKKLETEARDLLKDEKIEIP